MSGRFNSWSPFSFTALLVLIFPLQAAGQTGQFVATGSMAQARLHHRGVELSNGLVLVTGGSIPYATTASAEIYNPRTGLFAGSGSMTVARSAHSATQLVTTDKVLLAGGAGAGATAELYSPTTGTFTATPAMRASRYFHSATLLANGKVLLAGGTTPQTTTTATAEIYDPVANTFASTGSLGLARTKHTATRLASGKVLIAGGLNWTGTAWVTTPTAEVFDPTTGVFSSTGSMSSARNSHTATLLADGKVLVAGGNQVDGANGAPLSTAEIYDPATGTFSTTGAMVAGRMAHQAQRLPSGKVLLMGGDSGIYPTTSAEIFDAATGTFMATGAMLTRPRSFFVGLLLSNGQVLATGGYTFADTITATSELYAPQTCY